MCDNFCWLFAMCLIDICSSKIGYLVIIGNENNKSSFVMYLLESIEGNDDWNQNNG